MSQALYNNPGVETGREEQFALIERKEKFEDWFFKLMIPIVFLFSIIGSIILLS